jgi:(p)ppGpp synthase/HD superfamily hydrolase
MSTLEKAIEIAARAHAGQLDKAGQPYILHPLRIMFAVQGSNERMAAMLHDVLEDTDVTLEELQAAGFSATVLDAVLALTKAPGESRMSAASRAVQNPVAHRVKLADVADNMNLNRIAQPSERDIARLKEYEQVQAFLLAHKLA